MQGIESTNQFKDVPFRLHPRVFAALGADLVTNDVVAIIELVKNSYDAFARNVWVRFRHSPDSERFLEVEDDGGGMTEDVIKDAWCLVATPYKEQNRIATVGKKVRRVVGKKGLGRLSVARLGERLELLTQAPGKPCWEIAMNWADISAGDDLSGSFIHYRKDAGKSPFEKGGTRLRIYGLKQDWDKARIKDLEENLSRLVSPFSDPQDFNILLSESGEEEADEARIEAPEFLSKPKYSLEGTVSNAGEINATYLFRPVSDGSNRKKKVSLAWEQVRDSIETRSGKRSSEDVPECGPFSFEIRAWDIDSDGTGEIADKFELQKAMVRKAIRAHKGISVYRDGILVLPKSDRGRDWLGLDLRRVSRIGTRLSTSQVVGYVSISAEENPRIEDTSDRERLASCKAVDEFEGILLAVVAVLENEGLNSIGV
jgi:hypothetical protein